MHDGGGQGGINVLTGGGGEASMAVWWQVEAVMSWSCAMPNHNGKEDDRGVILVSGDHGQLQWARLSSFPSFSFLLLPPLAWRGTGEATEW